MPSFSILTAGDRHCSCPIWVPGALISLFLWGGSFSGLKCYLHMHIVISTQQNTQTGACTDPSFRYMALFVLCSVTSSFHGLSELTVPSSQLRGLTSFISCLLKINCPPPLNVQYLENYYF